MTTVTTAAKARRVRTGCLTCRDRHLKCDESQPDCFNCRKSNRACKRGIRLNWLDINVGEPPTRQPQKDWQVDFQDESREIASEYRGGLKRYGRCEKESGAHQPVKHSKSVNSLAHRTKTWSNSAGEMTASDPGPAIRASSTRTETEPRYWQTLSRDQPQPESHSSNTLRLTGNSVTYGPSRISSDNMLSLSELPWPAKETSSQQSYNASHESVAASVFTEIANEATSLDHLSTQQALSEGVATPPLDDASHKKTLEFLAGPAEIRHMQAFVDNVAVWMDAVNKDRYFSKVMPHEALRSPMLLNASMACGVQHLSMEGEAPRETGRCYYDTASAQLLRNLQNPDRNTAECAITAQVLNMYEMMCEEPFGRMAHVSGARALIKECGWDAATTTDMGSACFWLNISMELVNCLAENWRMTWSPEQWHLDPGGKGVVGKGNCLEDDTAWLRRILRILAKVADFRSMTQNLGTSAVGCGREQIWRLSTQESEWKQLKATCDEWMAHCPRSMHPVGYIRPEHAPSQDSLFPQVWLTTQAAVLGRLFYHLSLCLLAHTHPRDKTRLSENLRSMERHHAHAVCGIAAYAQDSSGAAIIPRCFAVAACTLSAMAEQQEALRILGRLKQLKWMVGNIENELKTAWGWEPAGSSDGTHLHGINADSMSSGGFYAVQGIKDEAGHGFEDGMSGSYLNGGSKTLNPLASADFSLPDHPYQNWYEPPNKGSPFGSPFT